MRYVLFLKATTVFAILLIPTTGALAGELPKNKQTKAGVYTHTQQHHAIAYGNHGLDFGPSRKPIRFACAFEGSLKCVSTKLVNG